MTRQKNIFQPLRKFNASLTAALLLALAVSHAGCFPEKKIDPYYGRVVTPGTQSFRWSDGGLPQTFDPAFAAAPPDTDFVRAIFEGLTDYEPRTLKPLPAVATRWESLDGGRVWTFYLRENARWSNGETVTAHDFVRSWQRTLQIGALAPHTELLSNIVGSNHMANSSLTSALSQNSSKTGMRERSEKPGNNPQNHFGAEAISDRVLRVRLERADTNFPALVAHPVFRPVKLKEDGSISNAGEAGVISNGAFSLARSEAQRVLLERADNYWARDEVTLKHVEFVGQKDAESALAAYRAGEVDAVSNAAFEPLAIKLLTPYKDFHRTTYGAITYYSFNTAHAPFDDVRVREALAIAIDRDRISQDEMGGSTEPAKRFLPEAMASSDEPVVGKSDMLEKDSQRARELMAEAGFPGGKAFPKVRLLINRNEQQRAVSQAVAGMWREVLNVETEIIIKNWDDYEAAVHTGDYDVVRRGIVMQTTDESTNMQALFRKDSEDLAQTEAAKSSDSKHSLRTGGTEKIASERGSIDSEEKALSMLSAMPIYFASSCALVKPYVVGFESNVLDAPSLKAVRINTTWRQDSGVVSQHMAGKRWH